MRIAVATQHCQKMNRCVSCIAMEIFHGYFHCCCYTTSSEFCERELCPGQLLLVHAKDCGRSGFILSDASGVVRKMPMSARCLPAVLHWVFAERVDGNHVLHVPVQNVLRPWVDVGSGAIQQSRVDRVPRAVRQTRMRGMSGAVHVQAFARQAGQESSAGRQAAIDHCYQSNALRHDASARYDVVARHDASAKQGYFDHRYQTDAGDGSFGHCYRSTRSLIYVICGCFSKNEMKGRNIYHLRTI